MDDANKPDAEEPQNLPPQENSHEEIDPAVLESQEQRRRKLMDISRGIDHDNQPEKPAGISDSPFGRMIFSIPVFLLFWWFFWHFFIRD